VSYVPLYLLISRSADGFLTRRIDRSLPDTISKFKVIQKRKAKNRGFGHQLEVLGLIVEAG
jgi:hypothetical protein